MVVVIHFNLWRKEKEWKKKVKSLERTLSEQIGGLRTKIVDLDSAALFGDFEVEIKLLFNFGVSSVSVFRSCCFPYFPRTR